MPSYGSPLGEQGVEDAAERVEVRRRSDVGRREADLLGRHPARGARAPAHRGLALLRAVEAVIDAVLDEPGEPEVEDVHERRLAAVGADRRGRWRA